MNRDEFINHVKTNGEKTTDTDKVLVSVMDQIHKYFSSIYQEVSKTDLEPGTFSVGSNGVLTSVGANYKEKEISFLRKDDSIFVGIGAKNTRKDQFDKLSIHNNEVVSDKYQEVVSDKLLDKYLPFLME